MSATNVAPTCMFLRMGTGAQAQGPDEEPAAHDVEAGQVAREGLETDIGEVEGRAVEAEVEAEDSRLRHEEHVRVAGHYEAVAKAEIVDRAQLDEIGIRSLLPVAHVHDQRQIEVEEALAVIVVVGDPVALVDRERLILGLVEHEVDRKVEPDADLAEAEIGLEAEARPGLVGASRPRGEGIGAEGHAAAEAEAAASRSLGCLALSLCGRSLGCLGRSGVRRLCGYLSAWTRDSARRARSRRARRVGWALRTLRG